MPLMDSLRIVQHKLDLGQENTYGDYKKMIVVFEKRFNCTTEL
jgi:hypothetical protein